MDSKGVDHALSQGDIDLLSERAPSWEAASAQESCASSDDELVIGSPPWKAPVSMVSVPKSNIATGTRWSDVGVRKSPNSELHSVRDFSIGNGRLVNENLKPQTARTGRSGGLAYAYEQEEEESFCGVQ